MSAAVLQVLATAPWRRADRMPEEDWSAVEWEHASPAAEAVEAAEAAEAPIAEVIAAAHATTIVGHPVPVEALVPPAPPATDPQPTLLPALPPEPPPVLVPDAEQEAVLTLLQQERFVDLSGTAGVGKTFVAKTLVERMAGVELCATTGIAAVNLGEGQTINSLIGYYDTNALRELFLEGRLQARLRKLRAAGLRRILLDEKSMLDAHQLTYFCRAIDEVNQPRSLESIGEGDNGEEIEAANAAPPLGLILVGDFGQLPPVKAPFAFESKEWESHFAPHRVALTTIRRQSDRSFIQALHAIRAGKVLDVLSYFVEDKFSAHSDDRFEGTTIFARNDAVDRYNQLRLDQLQGEEVVFSSVREGAQATEWKQIPQTLTLKIGALVMVLANRREASFSADDRPQLIYANGDLGAIVSVESSGPSTTTRCFVRLQRTGGVVPVKMVTREKLEPLTPARRKELRDAEQDGKIKEKWEITGSITYMPLRAAWASTVHKTQGLTLDRVQVNISDPFFGKPSMLFVALSRARTPQGLRIVGNQRLLAQRMAVEPKVLPWL